MDVIDPGHAFGVLQAVRERRPRVHCLTNHVARAFSANVLLAVGAVPSMSSDESEVGAFVAGADALLVNLGTLDIAMRASINVAMDVAAAKGLPIVIDPVFADRSDTRAAFARHLIGRGPAAVRCNRAEAEVIGDTITDKRRLSDKIIAVSGAIDHIYGHGRQAEVAGGHRFMRLVTAMGCALGAVQSAFLAAGDDPFDAICAACLLFKRAGQEAGAHAAGPGSFVPAFLDALHVADEALLRFDAVETGGR